MVNTLLYLVQVFQLMNLKITWNNLEMPLGHGIQDVHICTCEKKSHSVSCLAFVYFLISALRKKIKYKFKWEKRDGFLMLWMEPVCVPLNSFYMNVNERKILSSTNDRSYFSCTSPETGWWKGQIQLIWKTTLLNISVVIVFLRSSEETSVKFCQMGGTFSCWDSGFPTGCDIDLYVNERPKVLH